MRFATLALVLLFAVALVATASQSFDNVVPDKHDPGITPPPGKFQGGDTIESCTMIGGLPYNTTGTTAGYVDNYDEVCPYSGSTSPDVVYCWTADFSGAVDIHTCESGYDTKIYVYENVYTPNAPYACNDDNANCPGPVYRSWIEGMVVTAGNIYYVVVDGYGGDFGSYFFNMYEVEGPVVCDPYACPPGAFLVYLRLGADAVPLQLPVDTAVPRVKDVTVMTDGPALLGRDEKYPGQHCGRGHLCLRPRRAIIVGIEDVTTLSDGHQAIASGSDVQQHRLGRLVHDHGVFAGRPGRCRKQGQRSQNRQRYSSQFARRFLHQYVTPRGGMVSVHASQ